MFSLWQSYDNPMTLESATLDWRSHVRQAEAAALQTSLGRPDLSTTSWLLLVVPLLDVQLSWHRKNTAQKTEKKPLPRISLTFLSWLESELMKVDALPKCLEGFPWFSQKQEDNDGITDNTRKTSTTLWDWGVEEAFQLAVLSCCIEAFSKQRALVGLVIIRRQISLMSLSMSFKCSTISSTGIFFFGKACSSVRNAFVNAT